MMTTAHKRLDKIETFLTPKEWAIRLVDEIRSYPSFSDHFKELVKLPFNERPDQRAFLALKEQAGERHPGRKPGDIQVRQRLTSALWDEFHTLKLLIISVNQTMQAKLERISLEAGLKFSALHSLILEDAFAQTARRPWPGSNRTSAPVLMLDNSTRPCSSNCPHSRKLASYEYHSRACSQKTSQWTSLASGRMEWRTYHAAQGFFCTSRRDQIGSGQAFRRASNSVQGLGGKVDGIDTND